MSSPGALQYRRWHAPRDDRSILVDPPIYDLPAILAANHACSDACRRELLGKSLAQLRLEARQQVFQAARSYTSAYRDVTLAGDGRRLFLSGHQPELFHPGVWFKNFALSWLAARHGAIGVNLIIDSDTLRSAALRVPGGSREEPTLSAVPFDEPAAEIPFEQREILDRQLLSSFSTRACRQLASLVRQPMLGDFWPLVLAAARESSNLGKCLAQARHQYEAKCGLQTLELPQSTVCTLPAFCWFAVHLLSELPRFRRAYNEAVGEYRRVHGIRGTMHPVPDLEQHGDWLEAPFWIWRDDDPRRRRLLVRRTAAELILHDRRTTEVRLPLSCERNAEDAAAALVQLKAQGIKLRTRALATTLWARLVLADLFLHGIGGAKYDQVTDLLMQQFYAVTPPRYLTLSATMRLPIERPNVRANDLSQARQELRNLTFHPERFAAEARSSGGHWTSAADEAIRDKAHWIDTPQTRANGRLRCQSIRRVNEYLQPFVEQVRRQRELHCDLLARQLQAENILASREYAFCLYPSDALTAFLDQSARF